MLKENLHKIIINILYLLLSMLSIVFIVLGNYWFFCNHVANLPIFLYISIGVQGFCLYKLFKNIKKDFLAKDYMFFIITLITLYVGYYVSTNYDVNYIKEYGGIVKQAQVKSIYEGNRYVSVTLSYKVGGKDEEYTIPYDRNKLYKIREGDIMLIIYPEGCLEHKILYKEFPTQQQIELCRDSAFYINGKLISAEEYHTEYLK